MVETEGELPMAVLLHRIRTVARVAGPERSAQVDELFRARPRIT